MIDKSLVSQLVEERLNDPSLFCVSIDISIGNKIKIVLDGDEGVSIEKCISVSRNVEHNLDREVEDFSLEVTSFGLDHPLVLERQYKKYIDRNIEVLMEDNVKVKGKLLAYSQEKITMELELTKKQVKEGVESQKEINFQDIKEVKPIISFK